MTTVHMELDVDEKVAARINQVIALSQRGDVVVEPASRDITIAVLAARLGRTNADTDRLIQKACVTPSVNRLGVEMVTPQQVAAVYEADRQDKSERADRFHKTMASLGMDE